MPRLTYLPSPPQTPTLSSDSPTTLKIAEAFKSIPPFRERSRQVHGATLGRVNPLLGLPRSVRDCIYRLSLTDTPSWQYIEIPDIGYINLPILRCVDRLFWNEIMILVLQEATWSVASAPAVYNLLINLESWGFNRTSLKSELVRMPRNIEIVGLSMWEKNSSFLSDAARLLSRCAGVGVIKVLVDLREIPFTRRNGYPMVDIIALSARHDLERLAAVKGVREVSIGFWPFMRLDRMMGGLEGERIWAGRLRRETGDRTPIPGVERFWGLWDWLEQGSGESRVRVDFRQGS